VPQVDPLPRELRRPLPRRALRRDIPFDTFVEEFRIGLDRWDPEPWAELFQRAGARYVVLATKLEDGFVLWPSAHRNPRKERWQSDRDVVGELAAAVRARGMRFGTYYCGLDWTMSAQPPPPTDMGSMVASMPQGEQWLTYAKAHWMELIERYQPSLLWADYGFPAEGNWEELFRWYLGGPSRAAGHRPSLHPHERRS
jgi:alpha-L-fucosidase